MKILDFVVDLRERNETVHLSFMILKKKNPGIEWVKERKLFRHVLRTDRGHTGGRSTAGCPPKEAHRRRWRKTSSLRKHSVSEQTKPQTIKVPVPTCPRFRVTLTWLNSVLRDRGGLCHHRSVPSMALVMGWARSLSPWLQMSQYWPWEVTAETWSESPVEAYMTRTFLLYLYSSEKRRRFISRSGSYKSDVKECPECTGS